MNGIRTAGGGLPGGKSGGRHHRLADLWLGFCPLVTAEEAGQMLADPERSRPLQWYWHPPLLPPKEPHVAVGDGGGIGP